MTRHGWRGYARQAYSARYDGGEDGERCADFTNDHNYIGQAADVAGVESCRL